MYPLLLRSILLELRAVSPRHALQRWSWTFATSEDYIVTLMVSIATSRQQSQSCSPWQRRRFRLQRTHPTHLESVFHDFALARAGPICGGPEFFIVLDSADFSSGRLQRICRRFPEYSASQMLCRVWHYKSADRDRMRSFFASYP